MKKNESINNFIYKLPLYINLIVYYIEVDYLFNLECVCVCVSSYVCSVFDTQCINTSLSDSNKDDERRRFKENSIE